MRWEDSSLAVGVASILLPSAAEGSCPVELGNPPILALILLRHKGCTVLRLRYQLHQCGALKSQEKLPNANNRGHDSVVYCWFGEDIGGQPNTLCTKQGHCGDNAILSVAHQSCAWSTCYGPDSVLESSKGNKLVGLELRSVEKPKSTSFPMSVCHFGAWQALDWVSGWYPSKPQLDK